MKENPSDQMLLYHCGISIFRI